LYQEEKLINDTIFCKECQSQVQYSIKTSIYSIPEYFILCLEKEFIYSSKGLDYPIFLETKKFMEKSCGNYFLNSLIEYSGNRKAGHYIAKVSQENKWYYISDGYYKKIDDTEINDSNAIILFYAKSN
jgi:ubiquitin C-terminal hydrolase